MQLDSRMSFYLSQTPIVNRLRGYHNTNFIDQDDYYIGFEFSDKVIVKLDGENWSESTWVYVDGQNPFLTGQITPIFWEEVDKGGSI